MTKEKFQQFTFQEINSCHDLHSKRYPFVRKAEWMLKIEAKFVYGPICEHKKN